MARIERFKQAEQDPKIRATNFDEVSLGYDLEQAKKEAERCLNCKNAPCKSGCPVGVQIPEFLAKLKDGDVLSAGEIIKMDNYLPSVCGRVCPQEHQCEKVCVRARMEGAVAIGTCERFVGDFMLKNSSSIKTDDSTKRFEGKKVAVVGSGPSGLACAAQLKHSGVDVTIYEAFHKAGGVLVYGIPSFRLPKDLVKNEISSLEKMGVKIELNTVIGRTITIEQLLAENDAVFVGSGAGLPIFLNIEGENLNGVFSANEYLTRINLMRANEKDSTTPVWQGKNIAVIGAGNVAMDAARTAKRMGSGKVYIVYRRSEDEMPARKEELHHAKEEGVEFLLLTNPKKILGENGRVTALVATKNVLGDTDESGRRSFNEVPNSEFVLDVDTVIVALGTSPNPLIKDSCDLIETSKKGTIIVDENQMTSLDRVYAGGDAVSGAATVILAMGAGRKAANAILKRFSCEA